MSIDKAGSSWTGSEPPDTKAYLRAYAAEGYTVHKTRLCRCGCGSTVFKLEADRDEGCARRTCAGCGGQHLICDSLEHWESCDPEEWTCVECGGSLGNLAVGFSLYDAESRKPRDVRWISVGIRCVRCGTLGCFVDWKVAYGPSHHLLERV